MTETLVPPQEHNTVARRTEALYHREIMDDAGFNRRVYNFGDRELVFRGREELPVIPGFENALQAGATEQP